MGDLKEMFAQMMKFLMVSRQKNEKKQQLQKENKERILKNEEKQLQLQKENEERILKNEEKQQRFFFELQKQ